MWSMPTESTESNSRLKEVAEILALGFLRLRLRKAAKIINLWKPENSLADVAPRAIDRFEKLSVL